MVRRYRAWMEHCAYAPGDYHVDIAITEPGVRVIEEAAAAIRFDVLPIDMASA